MGQAQVEAGRMMIHDNWPMPKFDAGDPKHAHAWASLLPARFPYGAQSFEHRMARLALGGFVKDSDTATILNLPAA
jgi:hypothetical protein